jgi:membrane peptidoglycan carboxypeptidase
MHKVTGGSVPAKIWADFMVKALEKVVPIDFPRPSDAPLTKGGFHPENVSPDEKYKIRDVGTPKPNEEKNNDSIIKFFEE